LNSKILRTENTRFIDLKSQKAKSFSIKIDKNSMEKVLGKQLAVVSQLGNRENKVSTIGTTFHLHWEVFQV